jgi:hypothetical protein
MLLKMNNKKDELTGVHPIYYLYVISERLIKGGWQNMSNTIYNFYVYYKE